MGRRRRLSCYRCPSGLRDLIHEWRKYFLLPTQWVSVSVDADGTQFFKTGAGAWTYAFTWRKGSTNASFTMKSATSGAAISWVSPATVTRAVKGIYTGIAPDLVNAPDM